MCILGEPVAKKIPSPQNTNAPPSIGLPKIVEKLSNHINNGASLLRDEDGEPKPKPADNITDYSLKVAELKTEVPNLHFTVLCIYKMNLTTLRIPSRKISCVNTEITSSRTECHMNATYCC